MFSFESRKLIFFGLVRDRIEMNSEQWRMNLNIENFLAFALHCFIIRVKFVCGFAINCIGEHSLETFSVHFVIPVNFPNLSIYRAYTATLITIRIIIHNNNNNAYCVQYNLSTERERGVERDSKSDLFHCLLCTQCH